MEDTIIYNTKNQNHLDTSLTEMKKYLAGKTILSGCNPGPQISTLAHWQIADENKIKKSFRSIF